MVRTSTGTIGMQEGAVYRWHKAYFMDCSDPGSNCCDWLVVNPGDDPGTINPNQAYAYACSQISNGNPSGQIYSDQSSGSATINNVATDGSGLPCFIWGVTQNQENAPTTTVIVIDYSNIEN